jgi:large subunit ribosomal protein L25
MADKVVVKAEKRDGRGKNDARRMRQAGKVPVVVYGGGGEAVPAIADLRELATVLRSDTGVNTIFSLDMAGEGTGDVIFQDRQIDPLKGRLVHADLRRIAKGEKIEVTVAIHLIGEPIGVKDNEGGILNQQTREIKVLCETSKIPEFIEFDVSNLQLNESVHVSDLKVEEGVEIHESPETVIASVVIVKEVDLEPDTEVVEPELVDQKGDESEEGGAKE